jgi:sulfonate transport system substrate-binding protein
MKSQRRSIDFSYALVVLFSLLPVLGMAETLPEVIRISTGAGSPLTPKLSGANSGLTAARQAVEQEFAADGVKVEWLHPLGGGVASNEALASKAVDIGYAGEFPAIFGRAGGLKTRFIGGGFRGNNAYLVVAPSSSAKGIVDLKGKRIAIMKGQPWEYGFDRLLRSQGLTQADVKVVNLSLPDSRTALKQGQIDALYAPGVYGANLGADGSGRIIWSTRDAPRDWQFAADFFVDEDFAQKYPTTVKRFLKAVIRVSAWASDPKNSNELFQTWVPQGYSVAQQLKEYEGSDLRFRFSPLPDAFLLNHYKQVADYMYQNKLIRRPVDIDSWVDRSFVDAALTELQLENYWPDYDRDGNPHTRVAQQ